MPLQIRRGTEAERTTMSVPLAEGELLFVTDDKRLYIGAKDNLGNPIVGGVQITGYTNEDAQDAAATMLANGTHSGIVFTYNDVANELSASVDLSAYTGNITAAAFKGSVVADDSTMLIDAVAGRIVGPVFSNVTGNLTGNVTGDVTGNLTGTVTGNLIGTVNGTLIGDVKGSIFADDSSIVIDGTSGVIYPTRIESLSTAIRVGSATNGNYLLVSSEVPELSIFNGVTDGLESPFIGLNVSRGTLATPAAVEAGDFLIGWRFNAYDGSSYKTVAAFNASTTLTTNLSTGNPEADFTIYVGNNTDELTQFQYKGNGTFVAPGAIQLAVYANDAERDAAIPTPVQGMMVFMQSGTAPTVTNKTVVFDGTSWTTV